MSYLVEHELSWWKRPGCAMTDDQFDEAVGAAITADPGACRALYTTGTALGQVKWYEADTWLQTLSKDIPNVEFCLDCAGEDHALWKYYALNGQLIKVTPRITWPKSPFSLER